MDGSDCFSKTRLELGIGVHVRGKLCWFDGRDYRWAAVHRDYRNRGDICSGRKDCDPMRNIGRGQAQIGGWMCECQ